jgi:CheY-like chemotaxis protein
MSNQAGTVLLVDPDSRARTFLAHQLAGSGCTFREASDAAAAWKVMAAEEVRLVVTELYLPLAPDECLIHAIRRNKAHRRTRIIAHTHRSMAADREWAMRAGADAYLIKPTRAARLRYVVGRLTTERGANTAVPATTSGPLLRRDSLDAALSEIEQGDAGETMSIVFGRAWWEQLSAAAQTRYRKRATRARVNLRSDSMLGNHFVEVRGPTRDDVGLSTERAESPYRR